MKTEKGIPILGEDLDGKELAKIIALNAFRAMTDSLVAMEKSNVPPRAMMDRCVWPILEEAGRRFEAISDGEKGVPEDGFDEFM